MTQYGNILAEQSLIGCLLLSPEAYAEARTEVAADDFLALGPRTAWEAAGEVFSHGDPVDLLTLASRLQCVPGAPDLDTLLTWQKPVTTHHQASFLAREISAWSHRRRLLQDWDDLAAKTRAGEPVSDLLADSQQRLVALACRQVGRDPELGDQLAATMNAIEKRCATPDAIRGVPSGIRSLDRLMGGMLSGDFVIPAARPSVGKTALALGIAAHAALSGIPSLVLSVEMSQERLLDRLMAHVAGVDLGQIQSGHLDFDAWKKLQTAASMLSDAPMRIYDRPKSLQEVTSAAQRWRLRHEAPLALLVVDYLQLVEVDRVKGESREREVSRVAEGLKKLAKYLGAVVIAPSQFSRSVESESREPRLSDLRESGSIEQSADVVLFIIRDRMEVDGEAQLVVAKNRHGRIGTVNVRWRGAYQRFEDPDSPVRYRDITGPKDDEA